VTDQFSVVTQDLDAHANAVDKIADSVRQAGDAGRSVRAAGDAYGKICNFLPPLLGLLQNTLIQGITGSADDLRETAQKLHTTAGHYDSTDAKSSAAITRSGQLP
jgi:uncharacterized protein YukE